jgi:hypothetical protein
VREDGAFADWFEVETGVRQGCVLSPVLFNIFIDVIVRSDGKGGDNNGKGGVKLLYRLRDDLNGYRDAMDHEEIISNLMYADDMMLVAESEEELRDLLMRLEASTQDWGMVISVSKTKMMNTGSSTNATAEVELRGEKVESVNHFTYLGGCISADGSIDREVCTRISKAV